MQSTAAVEVLVFSTVLCMAWDCKEAVQLLQSLTTTQFSFSLKKERAKENIIPFLLTFNYRNVISATV